MAATGANSRIGNSAVDRSSELAHNFQSCIKWSSLRCNQMQHMRDGGWFVAANDVLRRRHTTLLISFYLCFFLFTFRALAAGTRALNIFINFMVSYSRQLAHFYLCLYIMYKCSIRLEFCAWRYSFAVRIWLLSTSSHLKSVAFSDLLTWVQWFAVGNANTTASSFASEIKKKKSDIKFDSGDPRACLSRLVALRLWTRAYFNSIWLDSLLSSSPSSIRNKTYLKRCSNIKVKEKNKWRQTQDELIWIILICDAHGFYFA